MNLRKNYIQYRVYILFDNELLISIMEVKITLSGIKLWKNICRKSICILFNISDGKIFFTKIESEINKWPGRTAFDVDEKITTLNFMF